MRWCITPATQDFKAVFSFLSSCGLRRLNKVSRSCFLTTKSKKYAFIASLLFNAQTRLLLVNPSVSKPCRPLKDGVSLNISVIFNVVSEGLDGAGTPPVFFCYFLKPLNSSPCIVNSSSKSHPYGIYGSSNFLPNFVFLRVCHAISKFTL